MTSPGPIVVVGGGVSGLAVAWRVHQGLARRGITAPVLVLEQSPRTGGVLRRGRLSGGPAVPSLMIDLGAESLLARRPEALDLIAELGLQDDLVHPRTSQAAIWSRGMLHPMPPGTQMGVPSDVDALRGLLTDEEVGTAAGERGRPMLPLGPDDDLDVAALVAGRLGAAVVDRLVDPLLGGVYAGRADRLSVRATLPALWPAARDGQSLLDAVAGGLPAAGIAPGPVFAGLRGGVGRLAETLDHRLTDAGVTIELRACVQQLRRAPGRRSGWQLVLGPPGQGRTIDACAVVLAVPAPAVGRLLSTVEASASAELAGVEVASIALVTVLLPPGTLDGAGAGAELSGVLVPAVEGRVIKAMTFSSRKWQWVDEAAAGHDVLRMSVGRAGDPGDLRRSDEDLVRAAVDDAAHLLGCRLPVLASLVTRWGGGLPQYEPGHVAMVDRVQAAVAGHEGLAVAGSVWGGVGVPACLATADAAAERVLAHLG